MAINNSSIRPTISTVARVAGVSVASVSRVLNGLSTRASTEQRVRLAVEQVGYVPDAVARSLKQGRTYQLAFAVADIGNPSYVAMMRAAESVVRENGYRLVVQSTGADPTEDAELVNGLARRYVDGLIISPIRVTVKLLRALAHATVPVVVVGNLPEGSLVDNVRTDSGLGVRLAVDHLVATGRREIAMVDGPLDTVPGSVRSEAFTMALEATGIGAGTWIEQAADFTSAAGRVATRRLLARYQPDAIMCANDLIAMGALRELAKRGLRVPNDIAIVGMDDTELAELSLPSLSSVSLQASTRGELAAHLLLDRIVNPKLPPRRETVPPRLVVRDSSAVARRGSTRVSTGRPKDLTQAGASPRIGVD